MDSQDLRTRINWMDRQQIVRLLEDQACIQCYDDESLEDLKEALFVNVEDGTIEIPDSDEDWSPRGPRR